MGGKLDERGKLYKLASYASDGKLRKLCKRRRATRAMQDAHNHYDPGVPASKKVDSSSFDEIDRVCPPSPAR